ncbi:GNAT family N-acetyltransferase, partial [Methanobrevibacter sp.]
NIFVHSQTGTKLLYNDKVLATLTDNAKNTMEIDYLQVPKTNQRMHIGQELVNKLIEYTKEQNKDIIVAAYPIGKLITQEDLIKFYKSCGFEQDEYSSDKNVLRYKINK